VAADRSNRSHFLRKAATIGALAAGFADVLIGAREDTGARLMRTVATLRQIATVDHRYQSYNVEMAEVIGGNFWKPYAPRQADSEPAVAAQSSSAPTPTPAGQDPAIFQKRPPIDL